MKGISFFDSARLPRILLYSLFMTLTVAVTGAQAQTQTTTEPAVTSNAAAPPPAPSPTPSETEAVQRRIARARSLAAVGRLAAAASELESLRAASADESVRDVARVLLMWIFVEMPDYARANALLEETFKERGPEAARVAYHALAGQTINGVRAHLERYRTFGINVADADLPAEAVTDLDQLRGLLERLVEHSKTMRGEEDAKSTAARSTETTALLEDAASVRLRLARNDPERTRWQGEVSEARQRLVASETRIASISSVPFSRPTPAPPTTTSPAPSASDAPGRGAPAKAADRQKTAAPARAANGSANNSPASSAPAASQKPGLASGTPAAGERQPVAIGSLHTVARQKSAPSYPSIARAARVAGVVTVYLVVNEKGEVESVTRADGPQQLQNAAADAARRWKFHPTVIDGQPVRVTGYISFNFAL